MKEKIKKWWFGFSERERYDILVKICLAPVAYLGVAVIFGGFFLTIGGTWQETIFVALAGPALILWWILKVGIVLGIIGGIGYGLYLLALKVAKKIQIKLKALAGQENEQE